MNQSGMPTVEIVDMREELKSGNRSMFSTNCLKKCKTDWQKRTNCIDVKSTRLFFLCHVSGLWSML